MQSSITFIFLICQSGDDNDDNNADFSIWMNIHNGDDEMAKCKCPICEDWKNGGKLYLAFFHHECKKEQYYAKGEEEWLMKYKRK